METEARIEWTCRLAAAEWDQQISWLDSLPRDRYSEQHPGKRALNCLAPFKPSAYKQVMRLFVVH